MRHLAIAATLAALPLVGPRAQTAHPNIDDGIRQRTTVVANVVALRQPIIYNRFGSHNPHGMIYALARDTVVQRENGSPSGTVERLRHSSAQLRPDRRPRPLVLRMNVGDTLEIRFLNLLPRGDEARNEGCRGPEDASGPPDWPATACAGVSVVGLPLAQALDGAGRPLRRPVAFEFAGQPGAAAPSASVSCEEDHAAAERNRAARQGLMPQRPGECRIHRFTADRPGSHLMLSHAAPAGGEGDGGGLAHGLFGVVVVEREGSRWYRSQVDGDTLDRAHRQARSGGYLNYEAREAGLPLLNLTRAKPNEAGGDALELVHGDLNAIVYCPRAERQRPPEEVGPWNCATPEMRAALLPPDAAATVEWWRGNPAHRAFTAVFHDELKTRYVRPFEALLDPEARAADPRFAPKAEGAAEAGPRGVLLEGIGDGFAINYGASGMGTILFANRLGIGPAQNCKECLYEEFFLQSWANGDPALLTAEMRDVLPPEVAPFARPYRDDPANTHHSYIGDRVAFHNLHAGPKETHVFHLHAHQWRAGAAGHGAYRDSQTVAPLQAFTYEIDHGGGGNLNLTPGDAIFHCHLYPHFAQGMWALWRNHDVLEDGTRTLPDGVLGPGTDPADGAERDGAPVPAVVPLPGQPMPPAPTYDNATDKAVAGRPGYPFFMPATAGHRAPQPPLDMHDDAGLPRHRITGDDGTRSGPEPEQAILNGDFVLRLETIDLEVLPQDGDARERRAMAFHAAQALPAVGSAPAVPAPSVLNPVNGEPVAARRESLPALGWMGFYKLPHPEGGEAAGPAHKGFRVNGRPPQRGAPFADPCRNTEGNDPITVERLKPVDTTGNGLSHSPLRVYEVSAVELDLVVNSAGWHDPQAHINVLTAEAERVEGRTMRAAPFFFRAHSGDCVEYRHQNRTRGELELDDFQVATPLDTIGQHIHLVKFDVLASDGSANGWNYEDGTFARPALCERVRAANRRRRGLGQDPLAVPDHCGEGTPRETWRYQSTVQRWYADRIWHQVYSNAQDSVPGLCDQDGWRRWRTAAGGRDLAYDPCRDATLRTVFTHDHFGPSSVQQHGFYSALLVEPEESSWFTADGRPMCTRPAQMDGGRPQDGCVMPVTQLFPPEGEEYRSVRALWRPNAQALIVGAGGNVATAAYHADFREFPMAVADFALLYAPGPTSLKPVPRRLSSEAQRRLLAFRERHGRGWPVDPPEAPEAISQQHHNPFLVNYGHDPVPLRIGRHSGMQERPVPAEASFALGPDSQVKLSCNQTRVNNEDEISEQRRLPPGSPADARDPGDLANAFDSWCHGDPFTEIFEAYEGEQMQVRLIQGAQEVQHVFNVPSMRWPRDADLSVSSLAGRTAVEERARDLLGGGTGRSSAAPAQRQERSAPGMAPNRRDILGQRLRPPPDEAGRSGAASIKEALSDAGAAFDLLRTGFVSAQEVGISEHFEFHFRGMDDETRLGGADHLWHFGSTDAIWNGAWGLIRLHDGTVDRRQFEWERGPFGTGSAPVATLDATCIVAHATARARGEPDPACDPAAVRSRIAGLRGARKAADDAAAGAPSPSDPGIPVAALPLQANPDWRAAWPYQSPRVTFLRHDGADDNGDAEAGNGSSRRPPAARHACPAQVLWTRRDTDGENREPGNLRWDALPTYMRSYEVTAAPAAESDGTVFRSADRRIVDPRPLRFTSVRMKEGGDLPVLRPEAIPGGYAPLRTDPAVPLVLRAKAGECVHVRLVYGGGLRQALDIPPRGEARLPGIVSLNATYEHLQGPGPARNRLTREDVRRGGVLLPSPAVSLLPQLVQQRPLQSGLRAGINHESRTRADREYFAQLATERNHVDYFWFAGRWIEAPDRFWDPPPAGGQDRRHIETGQKDRPAEHRAFVAAGFAEDYGGINLTSGADPFFHPAHGLVGMLVVHEAHAKFDPQGPSAPKGAGRPDWAEASVRVRLQGDRPRGGDTLYDDNVLLYRDGLNHWLQQPGRPLPDCPVCDDSYDRGERAAGNRAEPFWARLGIPIQRSPQDRPRSPFLPLAEEDGSPAVAGEPNLNGVVFPRRFYLDPPAATPRLHGREGVELRIHAGQPAGRARQRVFSVLGHDYRDGSFVVPENSLGPTARERAAQAGTAGCQASNAADGRTARRLEGAPWYGAPGVSLLGPGRVANARITATCAGEWLWRDGPAPMLASGVWGWLEIVPRAPEPTVAAPPRRRPAAEPRPAREARR